MINSLIKTMPQIVTRQDQDQAYFGQIIQMYWSIILFSFQKKKKKTSKLQ